MAFDAVLQILRYSTDSTGSTDSINSADSADSTEYSLIVCSWTLTGLTGLKLLLT
jgi:hypothetical protein